MAHAEIWTSPDIARFEGVQALMRSARFLIGRDDALAGAMLHEAMDALHRLLGDAATPVDRGRGA